MEWWTHLWLKEGFATWIEYLCVDHTHPEFEIWTNFLTLEYARALSLDALTNSHPIEVSLTEGRRRGVAWGVVKLPRLNDGRRRGVTRGVVSLSDGVCG